jgi:hypothetical protein
MEKRYIESGHPVIIVNGISGNSYQFDFIELNRLLTYRKLKKIQGYTMYLLIRDIKKKAPFLIGYGYKIFVKLEYPINYNFDFIFNSRPDYFLYTHYVDNTTYPEIINDILKGETFTIISDQVNEAVQ